MYTKQLLEDINSVVNNLQVLEDLERKNENLKPAAVKSLENVISKYKDLISQGKYNLVISSLRRLTEDISQITNEDNYNHETPMDVYHASHGSTSQEYDTQLMHNYSPEQVIQLCNAKIKEHGVGLVAKHLASI